VQWKGIIVYAKSEYVCPSCNGGIHRAQKNSAWLILALPVVYSMALAFSNPKALLPIEPFELVAVLLAAVGGVGY